MAPAYFGHRPSQLLELSPVLIGCQVQGIEMTVHLRWRRPWMMVSANLASAGCRQIAQNLPRPSVDRHLVREKVNGLYAVRIA